MRDVLREAVEAAGWSLESVRVSRDQIDVACRRSGRFDLWVAAGQSDAPCYCRGLSYRMGYRGRQASAEELALLDSVRNALDRAESEGWRLDPGELQAAAAAGTEGRDGAAAAGTEGRDGAGTEGRDAAGTEGRDAAGTEAPSLIYGTDQLEVRLTTGCNESCVFCNSHGLAENLVAGLGEALALVDAGVAAGARKLVVTGGEPLLVGYAVDLVREARAHGIRSVTLQTNGLLLPGRAEALREAGLDELLVSVHGPDEATVRAVSGRAGLYQKKMAGLRAGLGAGLRVVVNYVVCGQNLGGILRFVRGMARLSPRPAMLSFSFVAPSGLAWENRHGTIPRMREAAALLLAGLRLGRDLGLTVVHSEYCGIPTCILPELREFSEPCTRDRPMHVPRDKTRVAACRGCVWAWRCSGVFKRYLEMYGQEEFGDGQAARA